MFSAAVKVKVNVLPAEPKITELGETVLVPEPPAAEAMGMLNGSQENRQSKIKKGMRL